MDKVDVNRYTAFANIAINLNFMPTILNKLRWSNVAFGVLSAFLADTLVTKPAFFFLNAYLVAHHDSNLNVSGPTIARILYDFLRLASATLPWVTAALVVGMMDTTALN